MPEVGTGCSVLEKHISSAPAALQDSVPLSERLWQPELSRWFPVSLCSLFCLLEVNNLIHHPLWRDELQTWMIARSSHSVAELLYMKRYEGHPDLWFLLLYFLSRLTANPMAMQILHLFIAAATVYVVARFAPLTCFQKVLFAFGYFPFFEYATISRNYGIGMLLVFCFCAAYRAGPKKNYLWLSIVLSLLAQTSVYSLIIAIAFSLIIVLWEIISSPSPRKYASFNLGLKRKIVAFYRVVIFHWRRMVSAVLRIPDRRRMEESI